VKRLFVAPAARNCGLGARPIGELERLAQEQSLPVLRMDTRPELVEASRLYAALGYEEGPSPRHELRLSCPIADPLRDDLTAAVSGVHMLR